MTLNLGTMLIFNFKTNAEIAGGREYAAHKWVSLFALGFEDIRTFKMEVLFSRSSIQ